MEMLGTGRGRGGAKEGSSSLFLLRETNLVRRSVRGIMCTDRDTEVMCPCLRVQTDALHHRVAALRVDGAGDDHRELRGDGAGGAPPQRRQDRARRPAAGHRGLLPRHLLRGNVPQDRGPRLRVTQRI